MAERAGAGIGRQALASAGGGTVQSDQRRGASETGTIPTARVRRKERIERTLLVNGIIIVGIGLGPNYNWFVNWLIHRSRA